MSGAHNKEEAPIYLQAPERNLAAYMLHNLVQGLVTREHAGELVLGPQHGAE